MYVLVVVATRMGTPISTFIVGTLTTPPPMPSRPESAPANDRHDRRRTNVARPVRRSSRRSSARRSSQSNSQPPGLADRPRPAACGGRAASGSPRATSTTPKRPLRRARRGSPRRSRRRCRRRRSPRAASGRAAGRRSRASGTTAEPVVDTAMTPSRLTAIARVDVDAERNVSSGTMISPPPTPTQRAECARADRGEEGKQLERRSLRADYRRARIGRRYDRDACPTASRARPARGTARARAVDRAGRSVLRDGPGRSGRRRDQGRAARGRRDARLRPAVGRPGDGRWRAGRGLLPVGQSEQAQPAPGPAPATRAWKSSAG